MQPCCQVTRATDGGVKADPELAISGGHPLATQHVVRQQLWSKVDMMHSTTSAWRESEFSSWLEQKLESDRRELMERMREEVKQRLAEHQQAVVGQMSENLRTVFEQPGAGAGCGGHGHGHVRPEHVHQAPKVETPAPTASADPPGRAAQGQAKMGTRDSDEAEVSKLSTKDPSPREGKAAQGQPKMGTRDSDEAEVSKLSTKDTSNQAKYESKDEDSEQPCTFEASGDGQGDGVTRKVSKSVIKTLARRKLQDEQDDLGCKRYLTLKGLVFSNMFELVCSALIVLNTIVMAVEVQFVGCDVGYIISHPDCPPSTKDIGSDSSNVFLMLNLVFGVLFFIELLLRVAAMRTRALFYGWIWFDACVIILGFLDIAQRMGGAVNIGVNLTMMRTARIARILRIIRFMKPTEGFGSLFLIIRSIHASRHALMWSILILIIVMSCVGMMINQMVYLSLEDPGISEEDRRALFDYWGTFTRTMITMFEVTLGNWAPPSRLLMTRINTLWGLFMVVYRCIFCYSIVAVIGAVFIRETNRAADADDEVAMMKKEREQKANMEKLGEVFLELDESGDGVVTWDEFQAAVGDPAMRRYLATMELEVNDMEGLFRLLDDGDGAVEAHEFVEGITTLRGQAKNIDMLTLLKVSRKMNCMLERLESGLLQEDNHLEHGRRGSRRSSAGGPLA